MLRANQRALIQSTNNALLAIRNAELNYYSSFYLTFGGQAAIVGGFAFGSLTQITFTEPEDIDGYFYAQITFWLSSAMCLSASIHCILTTIFLQVFGPGLALHGPIGSMAKAAEGMRSEINSTFVAYVLMVVSLAIGLLMSFWLLMDWKAGVVSSIVLVYSISMWWRYCSRIYNKFYLEQLLSDAHEVYAEARNSIGNENGIALRHRPSINGQSKDNVLHRGYLDESPADVKWTRRYFILDDQGALTCYRSNKHYSETPGKPLTSRPIVLREYSMIGSAECTLVFTNQLDMRTKPWRLRADSEEELDLWVTFFKKFVSSE